MPSLYTLNICISCHIKIGKISYNYENLDESMDGYEDRRGEESRGKDARKNKKVKGKEKKGKDIFSHQE
jgi:hypothetical protein